MAIKLLQPQTVSHSPANLHRVWTTMARQKGGKKQKVGKRGKKGAGRFSKEIVFLTRCKSADQRKAFFA